MSKQFDVVVDSNNADFTVHKHGCRDVARAIKNMGVHFYTVEGDTPEQVVSGEVAEYQLNEQDWCESDFRIMPCCSE